MATLRELMIEIGIDADMQGLGQLEKGMTQVMDVAKKIGVAIAGATAAVFGLTKSTANYADKIQDTAWAMGMSNEQLQTLGHAAQLSGSSLEEAADSFKFLSRSMLAAQEGTGAQAEAFQALGVKAVGANGKLRDSNVVFNELADAFAKLPNGAEKTAMAMEIFGRAGAKLIPMLNQGSQGIGAMRQEAIDLGLVLDDVSIQAGSDFNDAFDRLKGVFTGLKNSIGAALLPAMQKLVDTFRELIVANMDVIKQNLTRIFLGLVKVVQYTTTFIGYLGSGFRRLSDIAGGLVPLLKAMGFVLASMMLGSVIQGIYNMAKGFIAVARSIMIANSSAMLIPALIGAAILLVGLIIDDFLAFLDGRPSFLGFLLKNKDEILKSIQETIKKALQWLDKAFLKIFDLAEQGITAFFEFFGVPQAEAAKASKTIVDAFRYVYQFIKEGLSSIVDGFIAAFRIISSGVRPVIENLVAIVNEPLLFFTRFHEIVKQIFLTIGELISSLVSNVVAGILNMLGVPQEYVDKVVAYIEQAFSFLSETVSNVAGTIAQGFADGIGFFIELLKGSVSTIVTIINSIDDVINSMIAKFKAGIETVFSLVDKVKSVFSLIGLATDAIFSSTSNNESVVSSIAQSPTSTSPLTQSGLASTAQNTFDSRSVSSSSTVSPTINVTVQGGGDGSGSMSMADDIARAIRDEIAGVAENMSKSSTPQFAQ